MVHSVVIASTAESQTQGVLMLLFFFVAMAVMGYFAIRIGLKRGRGIKESRTELQRIDTIRVALDAAQVRKIAREETDGPWERDYGDDAVGYVHSDALTIGTGVGFGIRAVETAAGSTVTVFPYARGMSLSEEVHIGVHGYSGMDLAVDAMTAARAWKRIAPVRQRIIDRLTAHATAPPVSEVLD